MSQVNSARQSASASRVEGLDANVEAIRHWERSALRKRTRSERVADWVTRVAPSGPMLLAHVALFGGWIVVNAGIVPRVPRFDPFPYPLLTFVVSIEAIFLTMFVLASQNRLGEQADKRAHLDLQIDLLAEQEMTIVLRLIQDLTTHLGVNVSVTPEQVHELMRNTDIHALTHKLDDMTAPPPGGTPARSRPA